MFIKRCKRSNSQLFHTAEYPKINSTSFFLSIYLRFISANVFRTKTEQFPDLLVGGSRWDRMLNKLAKL